MHVLNSFQHLVHNIFLMNVFHNSSPNNSMQICLHKVEHKINVFGVFGLDYVEETDDVWMAVELLEENNLG